MAFVCLGSIVFAQSDREFWFAAPEIDSANYPSNGLYDRPVLLRLATTGISTSAVISIPANPTFVPITVNIPANSTSSIDLTEWINLIENDEPNVIRNKGLLIQSSAEITAYYEVQSLSCRCNPELFALKGRNAIGNEFFIPSQLTWAIDTLRFPNARSAFDIVATEDNTSIVITPNKPLIDRQAGVPFTIILNKGQTFSSQGLYHNGSNLLNGSKIVSNKPIAVTTKEDLLFSDGPCADLAGDQLVPTSVLGDEYAVVRGNLSVRDKVVITAISNGTNIFLDGGTTAIATINAGESYEADITSAPSLYIKTTKKVYVLHYSGNSCEVGSAVIPKLNCTGSSSVSIVRSDADQAYVLIVTKNGNQGDFQIDGNNSAITAADFLPLTGTSGAYVFCKKEVSAFMALNTSTTFSNVNGKFQLGFLNGSAFFGGCLYGYFSDYKKSNVTTSQLDLCAKDSAQLNAFGGVSYSWSPSLGLSSTSVANPKASPATDTKYSVIITDADGCIDSAFVDIRVKSCEPQALGCNTWLKVNTVSDAAVVGDIDVIGNQMTVEAMFNRTTPYTPADDYRYAGDIVSKHGNPSDCNYLLRPRHAEITTTDGFFSTPAVCDLELNKTYHVAMVYDGNTLKFYRNGFLLSQVKATGNLINNNRLTKIGDIANIAVIPENFTGYINEVKIWNVARTQAQLRAYINASLPTPTTQIGLQAYYTFDNLTNKQGNALLNGTLSGAAAINQTNPACNYVADSCEIPVSNITPDFTMPDTVCVNTPVTITNKTVGATTHYWSFCVADINQAPGGENLGNIDGVLETPVYIDYAYDNGNYYGYLINHNPGGLVRLDFGNSLLNKPTATNLGNFGDILPPGSGTEGIQLIKNEGKWYAIIVGGYLPTGSTPRVIKIEFGANLSNPSPIAINWGNVGNMDQPLDLHVFKEGDNWYGLTVNAENNSITRLNFTNSFSNIPTAENLGNLGNLAYPTGIFAINDNGFWRVFVVNGGNRSRINGVFSLTRLDFGSSLLNTPTAINLGNPGNTFKHPRDITVMKSCGQTVGFVVNGHQDFKDIVKLDFNDNLSQIPSAASLGNLGDLDFPVSISKLFRVNNDLYSFIPNAANNTLTKISFTGCTNASIPNSTLKNPPAVKYALPGNYSINLTIDDGLPTQASLCKQVVVLASPVIDFSYQQDVCNPLQVKFFGSDSSGQMVWDFGDGSPLSNLANPTHVFGKAGSFKVRFSLSGPCPSTIEKTIVVTVLVSNIIQNKDTVICENGSVQLMADAAAEYCWTPATYLSNSYIGTPIAKPLKDITYSLVSKTVGANLVVNGDFTNGNTAFSSGYNYASTNLTEGQFFVGNNPRAWNGALSSCADHTGTNGNMLLVNGSPEPDIEVWSQSISVLPNTNFEFSTWVQALWPPNPAKLQFSINGIVLGETITAALPTCTWSRFNTNWNSGTNTTAVISIVNKNTEIQGNDFALDDISFAPITYRRDSVKITIDKPSIKTSNDTAVCAGSPVPLKTVGGATYSWSPAAGLSNTSIGNPIATVTDTTRYVVTGTNAEGCIAKDTVVISVIPPPLISLSNDTAICGAGTVQLAASGALSYQWSPAAGLSNPAISSPFASPLNTTKYKVNAIGANGCSAIDSVIVQVLPNLVINVSNDTLVCGNSKVQLFATGATNYKWSPSVGLNNPGIANPIASPLITTKYVVTASNGQCSTTDSVTIGLLPAPIVSLSADTAICKEGGASLVASGGISYAWSPSEGLSSTLLPNPIATPASTTKYKVTVTGANTCTATDSVIVSVLPAPVVILSKDTSICGVGSVPLMASGGISYVWSPSLGLSSSLIANPLASPTTSTAYQVKVTGANTCTANGSVLVKVLPALITSISNDTAVCIKSKAQLVVTGGSTYDWTPSTGLNNAFIANPIASPTATTVYTVKITGANNCMATESVTVTMLSLPVIGLSNDTVICRSGSFELKATGGSAYQWSPAATLSNPLIANPLASPTVSTTYTVLATGANSCSVTDSVSVNVRPAPQFGIVNTNFIGCEKQPIQLGAFGGDKYSWSPSTGLSNASIANPIAKLQTSQSFTVVVSESICKEQASFVVPVAIRPLPAVVVLKSNDITCNTPFAQLNTNIVGRNYSWTPSTGLSNIAIANPLANPATPTTYTVSVLDTNGCISKGSVAVNVYNNNDFRLYQMPNAFTPDRNGSNDCFGVTKWGTVKIVYFEIYNRWGQLVFSGSNSRQCWDGTFNGQAQPTGNFVYKIKVETMCGVVEKKGNVVLIR